MKYNPNKYRNYSCIKYTKFYPKPTPKKNKGDTASEKKSRELERLKDQ